MTRRAVWAACATVYAFEAGWGLDYMLRALFRHDIRHPVPAGATGGVLAALALTAAVDAIRRLRRIPGR
jgi:hypothetical protein